MDSKLIESGSFRVTVGGKERKDFTRIQTMLVHPKNKTIGPLDDSRQIDTSPIEIFNYLKVLAIEIFHSNVITKLN